MSTQTDEKQFGIDSAKTFDDALGKLSPDYNPLADQMTKPIVPTGDELTEEQKAAAEEAARLADEKAKEDKTDNNDKEGESNNEPEIEIEESQLANTIISGIVEKFDLQLAEDFKVESMDDVYSLINELIVANQGQDFASEEIKELNEYVAKGGKISDYLDTVKTITDWETFEPADEDKQKLVVRQYYKDKGLAEAKIEKIINGLVIDDELESESKELLGELKENAKAKKVELKKQADIQIQQQQKAQQEFYENSVNVIKNMNDFNGVKLSEEDRKRAIAYVFGVDKATGKSYEQLDYEKDPIGFRLSMALLRTKKDLQGSLEKKATTEATRKFKTNLKVIQAKDLKKNTAGSGQEVDAMSLLDKHMK